MWRVHHSLNPLVSFQCLQEALSIEKGWRTISYCPKCHSHFPPLRKYRNFNVLTSSSSIKKALEHSVCTALKLLHGKQMKTKCLSCLVVLFCWWQQKDQSLWNISQDSTCLIVRACAWFILAAFTPFGFCTFLTYLNKLFHTFFIQALAKQIFVRNILHSRRTCE